MNFKFPGKQKPGDQAVDENSRASTRKINLIENKKRHLFKAVFKICCGIFILAFLVTIISRLLSINNIECRTAYGICPDEVNNLLEGLKGIPIYSINRTEVEKTLFDYKIDKFEKIFPGKIKISIQISKPAAILEIKPRATGLVQKYLISDSGIVLGETSNQKLPVIESGEVPIIMGEQVSDLAVFQAVKLIGTLIEIGFAEPKVIIQDKNFKIENIIDAEVISGINQDPVTVATTLQGLLTKVTIDGNIPRKIDLRFDQPILLF